MAKCKVLTGSAVKELICVISLVSLEVLELRDNLIRFLPSSLGSLTRLQSLDLGSNLIDILVRHLACMLFLP